MKILYVVITTLTRAHAPFKFLKKGLYPLLVKSKKKARLLSTGNYTRCSPETLYMSQWGRKSL
jgi:hypothetical protein